MRLPWVSRRQLLRQEQVTERYREWAEAAQKEADGLSWKLSLERTDQARRNYNQEMYISKLEGRILEVAAERDEALARVADLERALGQFSAGEAATDDTADLCDCPVSVVNEHLTGYCGTARLEASKAGTLMSTDCTCPPGWKHRATDCPFNPNPEQRWGSAMDEKVSARLRCHRCHRTLGVRLADGSWEMLSDSATVVHDGVQRTVCQRCALGVSA